MENWVSQEREIDTLIIWIGGRKEYPLNWCVGGCWVFCLFVCGFGFGLFFFFLSSMPVWVYLAQGKSITLARSDLEVMASEDGVSPVPYRGERLGRFLVNPVHRSCAGTNQGMQPTLLCHCLCSAEWEPKGISLMLCWSPRLFSAIMNSTI